MRKLLFILLLLPFAVSGQVSYQLNYDSIRVGKTAGTSGIALYGDVYLKNVSARAVGDSILTVVNGRIFKVPFSGVNLWTRSGTTLSPRTANDSLNIGTGIYKGHGAKSDASDGFLIESSTGVDVGRFGVANTANASLFGGLTLTGSLINTNTTEGSAGTDSLIVKSDAGNIFKRISPSHYLSSLSFGTFGSTPNAQGGSYSAGVLTLQPASASFPGGVTTGAQTIAGAKTLTGATILGSTVLIGSLTPIANNGAGSMAPLEVANAGADAGIALSNSASAAYSESYLAAFGRSSASIGVKSGVLEFRKARMSPLNESYLWALKSTKITSGTSADLYSIVNWAGEGMSIFPSSPDGRIIPDTTFAPGNKVLKVNGVISQTKMDAGTAGTDSIEVRDAATRQTKRISPSYYLTPTGSGSGLSGVVLKAGDTMSGVLNGVGIVQTTTTTVAVSGTSTSGNAINGSATTGSAIYGINSGAGGAAITGIASDQSIAGSFSNTTTSLPTLFIQQNGAANVAQFQTPTANIFIGNTGSISGINDVGAVTGTFSGNVGINVAPSATVPLTISKSLSNNYVTALTNSHPTTPYGLNITFSGGTPNDATREFINAGDATAVRFTVRSNGGIANYSANDVNLSDERVKKNIIKAGSYWDIVKAIEFDNYKYKDQKDTRTLLGVMAQQVEKINPQWVNNSASFGKAADGTNLKSVYEQQMQYGVNIVVQEAMQRIESLEAEIKLLKTK